MEKKICEECGIEKKVEISFYKVRTNPMHICKDCFKAEFENIESFKKHDIPFIYDLWEAVESKCNYEPHKYLDEYMRHLSLPQFKDLRWKDSKLEKGESGYELSFNEEIIINLKNEIKSLNGKIKNARENGDFGTYRNLIVAYKEVLKIIQDIEYIEARDKGRSETIK